MVKLYSFIEFIQIEVIYGYSVSPQGHPNLILQLPTT